MSRRSEHDLDALAANLVGGASDLISAVLLKHARGVVLGIREVYEELRQVQQERDEARHRIATIVTNLRHGASGEEVLAWYDEHATLEEEK